MQAIVQVTYTSEAGPILPERRWHETMTITEQTITFVRSDGGPGSQVNAGTWTWAAETAVVTALFAQLATVDCTTLKRIEPDDPPDGGHTESYTLTYARHKPCTLVYNPGVRYTSDAQIVEPMQAFMRGLRLPQAAASRYSLNES